MMPERSPTPAPASEPADHPERHPHAAIEALVSQARAVTEILDQVILLTRRRGDARHAPAVDELLLDLVAPTRLDGHRGLARLLRRIARRRRVSPPARSTACSTCCGVSLPTTKPTILHAYSTRGGRLSATRCTRNTRRTGRPCPTIWARRSGRCSTPSGPRAGLCCRSKEWRRTTSSARSRKRPRSAACAA